MLKVVAPARARVIPLPRPQLQQLRPQLEQRPRRQHVSLPPRQEDALRFASASETIVSI